MNVIIICLFIAVNVLNLMGNWCESAFFKDTSPLNYKVSVFHIGTLGLYIGKSNFQLKSLAIFIT